MADFVCPACGSTNKCTIESGLKRNAARIHCATLGTEFFIGEEILAQKNKHLRTQLYNLITELLLRKRINADNVQLWFFIYRQQPGEEYEVPHCVNLYDEKKNYPSNIVEHVNRTLLNLSILYSDVGSLISIDTQNPFNQQLLFCASKEPNNEAERIVNYLLDLGYVAGEQWGTRIDFYITYLGWEKIEELSKRFTEVNQGFIAMSYSDDAKQILETFRTAIQESGFDARVIGEKEHNHQIVPEMFFEIERSKFMVVDVTYQNYGAYYEAGYAQALGKEVIVCCSKEVFDDPKRKPHFDIAQKPIIIWTDFNDLKTRLVRRIQATVH